MYCNSRFWSFVRGPVPELRAFVKTAVYTCINECRKCNLWQIKFQYGDFFKLLLKGFWSILEGRIQNHYPVQIHNVSQFSLHKKKELTIYQLSSSLC